MNRGLREDEVELQQLARGRKFEGVVCSMRAIQKMGTGRESPADPCTVYSTAYVGVAINGKTYT